MPLRARVVGLTEVKRSLSGVPKRVTKGMNEAMSKILAMIQRHIQVEKLSNSETPPPGDQGLAYRSGNLFRSIHTQQSESSGRVTGSVYLGEEAWYGKLHELGGTFTVPAHTRRKFHVTASGRKTRKVDSIQAVPKSGESYTVTFPRRSFMASAVREMRAQILSEFGAQIRLELNIK